MRKNTLKELNEKFKECTTSTAEQTITGEIKVKITLPENVTEVIKQQKINTLYDLWSKSGNSSEKNTEFKKIS